MSQNNMAGMGAWGVGCLLTDVLGAQRTVMTSVSSQRLKGSENQGLCAHGPFTVRLLQG